MNEVVERRALDGTVLVRMPMHRPVHAVPDTTVRFYDDEHLVHAPAPARGGRGGALVGALQGASSSQQRHRLMHDALQDVGFEWLAYGSVKVSAGRCEPISFFTPFAHPLWTQRYFTQRHHEVDERQRDAAASSLPLVWDIADMDQRAAVGGHARRFTDQLCSTGIGSGVLLSLASSTRADERIVISLMARATRRDWIGEGVVGQALVLALSLHEFLSQQVQPALAPAVSPWMDMSATQQDILNCLIEGHSDKVIAHRLSMSSHAVDYHMRQLRRRFSARNRVQLVHAAIDRASA